jgi:oligo-1,6-glucosidase
MDVITMISKDQRFPDGVVRGNEKFGDSSPYVNNGPRVHEYLKEMNEKVISRFDWMTVGEGAGAGVEDAKRYAGTNENELDMIFTFEHVNLGQTQYGKWSDGSFDLVELKKVFQKWEDGLEGVAWNSLYWDNHDQPRAVSRFGNDSEEYREISAKMLATCLHFMKGTPYIYQGEELGMTNPHFTEIDQYRDVESLNYYKILREQGKSEAETLNILAQRSRDDGRTPMQWDSSPNAGFTSGTPWIGVADNYKSINAAAQTSDADSIYSFYKAMVRLRKEHRVISEGKIEFLYPDNTDLLAYRRYGSADKEELLVLCNLTEQEIHAELPDAWATAEKLIGNYADNPSETLRPYECVVLHTTNE